ncbi:MAG TPA: helix-turn-helix domain-containing protein [Candidatus Flavonifractor merdavium]|nr:helix-turn-helix domain-containing protein [Candidatus Flavonifractor merdavium]
MMEKSTGDLQRGLMEEPDLNTYLKKNRPYFFDGQLTQLLTELYRRRHISKAALARKAGMSEVYLHQVFSGRRVPSRDRLLCLCIAMGTTLEETQQLLLRTAYAQLYPRLRRDAVISHGLVHGKTLGEINEALMAAGERTLF